MHFGVFDLFKIGIGPSSSHTVGPMKASRLFLERVDAEHGLKTISRVKAEAYGSLALTGSGHATDKALIWGLAGEHPETADPNALPGIIEAVRNSGTISLLGRHQIGFDEETDLVLDGKIRLPFHSNAMPSKVSPSRAEAASA